MEKSALLAIDVQNYFMNGYTKILPQKIAAHLSQDQYDFVVFTKFVNQKDSNFVRMFGWNECNSSPDTDLCPELIPFIKKGNVFEKHTFSAFKNQKLHKFLKANHVKKLFICGTDSEACVLSTMFEGFDLGYDVHILKELCASCNGTDFHEYARKIIERNLEPIVKSP